MDQKEGEGEEVREEKKTQRIVVNICLSVGRRKKTARSSGATPRERREKSATSDETSGDVDDGCCLMSSLRNSFRHFTQRLFVLSLFLS